MRNLWCFLVSDQGVMSPSLAACVDPFTATVYSVTQEKDLVSTKGLTVPLPSDLFQTALISMTYIQDKEMCCLVFQTGEILWAGESSLESVSISPGNESILAAKWSPSQELLAVVTGNAEIWMLNGRLDVVSKGVVWGGKGEVEQANIEWKPDGKYVEITVKGGEGWLAFTYSKDAQLFISSAKSDPPGGLVECLGERPGLISTGAVSWQPEGLLAGLKDSTVVLWEKNGLKHGQFATSLSDIQSLHWNSDGELLCLLTPASVCLYHRSNYHWYLKHSLSFPTPITSVHWLDAFRLLVITDVIYTYEFKWTYDTNSEGSTLVIDGNKANFTLFSQETPPPPLFTYDVSLPNTPKSCAFAPDGTPYLLIDEKIYRINGNSLENVGNIDKFTTFMTNLTVGSEEIALSAKNALYIYSKSMVLVQIYPHSKPILAILPSRTGGFYFEDDSGSINFLQNSQITQIFSLPKPCISLNFLQLPSKPVFFLGFHRSSKSLYLNSNLLSNQCINYHISGSFLVFTVQSNAPLHEMYIFDLNLELPMTLLGPNSVPKLPEGESFNVRKVERGARIVAVSGNKAVLQMPRGNLETVYPRLMLISHISGLLQVKKYGAAFDIIRKHKLDLNFLCDWNYEEFEKDIKVFVRENCSAEKLNLFLTALNSGDSARKYLGRKEERRGEKVTKTCELVRKAIGELELTNPLLLSIVTSYIRSDPPLLVETLRLVQDLKQKLPLKPHKTPHLTQDKQKDKVVYAEDALKYACWLVDANKLYEVALGTYDLELVLMVAQFTSKDPKEYLPYLQSLSSLPDLDRHIQINLDLGRFPTALAVIRSGNEAYYPSALRLITEKSLYGPGLNLYKNTPLETQIYTLYGDFLMGKRQYFQAGIEYKHGKNHQKAVLAFQNAQEWDLMFASAAQIGVLVDNLAREQVNLAMERGDFKAASYLLRNYCEKNEETGKELVKCAIYLHRYREAVAVATGIAELEEMVKNAVLLKSREMRKDLIANTDIYKEKRARLETVRSKKASMPQTTSLLTDEEVASQYSVDSKMSKATAVSKGKAKTLKKIRKSAAKEGSQYEEEYLVDVLLTLRPGVEMMEQADEVMKGLMLVGETDAAIELQSALHALESVVSEDVHTLRQDQFLSEFHTRFPDIQPTKDVDARLCDIVTENYFLSSGQASHVQVPGKFRKEWDTFVDSFKD